MNRDAYSGLPAGSVTAEDIEAALDWRYERFCIAEDWPMLRNVLRFWEANGRPLLHFTMNRVTGEVEIEAHSY